MTRDAASNTVGPERVIRVGELKPPKPLWARIRRGPLYMILAGVAFTVMVGLVKIARQEMGAFEVVFWRALASVPLALVVTLWTRAGLRVNNWRGMILRSVLGFGAMAFFFTAAKGLSLADLSLIGKLQPILVAFLAPLALGKSERASRLIWVVLACGISGCALIIGPDLQVGSLFGLFAVMATICSAGAHVTVRALGKSEPAPVIVFWYQALASFYAIIAYAIVARDVIPLPPMHLWPHLLVAGTMATIGQLLITKAYAIDRAAPVAAASYATVLFGFAGDLLVFHLLPAWTAILGGVLVVGAGIILLNSGEDASRWVEGSPSSS